MPSSGFSFTGSSQRHEPDLCEKHEEKLKLYCEDDQLAICLVCGMSRGHKTHNVIPINEAFENYKERAGDIEEQVSAEFGRLREFLLQEEERVKERVRREKEERLNQLEEALKHTTEQISQLEQTADQLHIKLQEEEYPAQLRGIKDFIGGTFDQPRGEPATPPSPLQEGRGVPGLREGCCGVLRRRGYESPVHILRRHVHRACVPLLQPLANHQREKP
ncbi:E3 ubiquitin-protein ligase TRIM17-like [Coregonus clupeaformis]|uniref:E3 ubiquitin-protein ligase TRIM17-like n=1 Tax=Coregonus clupeaformis TaxID=59861 RepID=UPI001BDF7309|nr:E3 ubiquitin-protein ligase TRIM17-like [Coregonus clupeaformis]